MQIERIVIDGYGHFAQQEIGPLGSGLTIIYGQNESGKTTLQRFIVAMLFGFPRRNSADWIEALAGGRHGGRLILRDGAGERLIVERHHDGRRQALQLTLPDGRLDDEECLRARLGEMSAATYKQLFALELADLQSLGNLPAAEVSSRIYGAGLGAERAPDLLADLERDAGKIFKPRGENQPVRETLDRLAKIERSLDDLRERLGHYPTLLGDRAEVSTERDRQRARLDARRHELAQLDEIQRQQREVDRQLTALGPGWDRERLARMGDLNDALETARDLEQSLAQVAFQLEAIERRIANTLPECDAQDRLARMDAARAAWINYQQGSRATQDQRPASSWLPALLMIIGLAGLLVGIALSQPWWPVGAGLLVIGVVWLIVRQRQPDGDRRQVQGEAGRFVQLARAAGLDPQTGIAGLEQVRADLLTRIQACREAVAERERLIGERDRRQLTWRSWLVEHGLSDDLDPEAAANLIRDLMQAQRSLASARSSASSADLAERRQRLVEEIDLAERELGRSHERLGELQHAIEQLEVEEGDARLRAERAGKIAELGRLGREWTTLIVAQRLLEQAVQRFEEEHQPAVVREASRVLAGITDGAYQRIAISFEDARAIVVITPDGQRKTPQQLSQGTREQLYLALRFGLARAHAERNEPLPLLLDDVLVNFDPQRAQAATRVLLELARCQQVLLFTCHPETVEHAREVGDPCVIRLGSMGDGV